MHLNGGKKMTTEQQFTGLKVGQAVPDFEMDTYDPAEYYFGKISFDKLKKEGKWTILFFYPADFTFV